MTMIKLNPFMFREYDIRGHETPEELNADSVRLIASAFGTFLQENSVKQAIVGHDNRKSSEEFYHAAIEGLTGTGIEVTALGLSLTPQVFWAQANLQIPGALIITASHNPAGWNGLKLSKDPAFTLLKKELEQIYEITTHGQFKTGQGKIITKNISEQWQKDLLTKVNLKRPLKIVLNTANAASSFFSPKLLRAFGCEVIEQNTNPDPNFPNYPPNPANVKMLSDMGKTVCENKADAGIGIDADGDRLGVVDEKGNPVWPDKWLAMLSREALKKTPNGKIIVDVKISETLLSDIKTHGGQAILCPTGSSYIKHQIKNVGAIFGGEASGHAYFTQNFYGFDDGNFAALRFLEILSMENKTVSALIATTPASLITPAMYANVEDSKKYQIVEKIVNEFKKEGYKVIDLSGGRVYALSGWGIIRATSNLPAIEIRFEAKAENDLEKIQNIFKEKLNRYPEVSKKWESV